MNDGILREPDEKRSGMFQPGRLFSLIDILGAGYTVCDICGRWQNFSALSPEDAHKQLEVFGWSVDNGADICPKCTTERPSSADLKAGKNRYPRRAIGRRAQESKALDLTVHS